MLEFEAAQAARAAFAELIPTPILPYAWMLFGSLAIAVMATFTHALADRCHWEIVAAVRAGLALVIATALALHARARLVVWRPRILWLRSIAGTMSLLCMFYALPRLPVSDVLVLMCMFPVWVALLSWPVDRKPPSKEVWLAIAVGICGVVLVAQPHLNGERPLAALAALGASFSTAVAMLGLNRLQDVDPRAIVAHFSGVSFIVCLVVLSIDPSEPLATTNFATSTLGLLAGVGAFATIGQLLLTKAFAAGSPAKVSVVALTQVGFGMIFDAVVWRHSFGVVPLVGMALVMAPTAWLIVRQRRSSGSDRSILPPAT